MLPYKTEYTMRVLLFLFCLWTRPSLGMNATEFFKGAAATEDHLLWNQPTNWLLRSNQVRSPDSGQGLGWINPAHRCWIACLSAAKPIWPPARQSLVISLSAKKMGQKIRPKKRSWPGPVNQTSVGGSALTNVEMRRKSWAKCTRWWYAKMDTQHLAAFRTQACQIVIPSQSYLGIAMKFTLYVIMAHTGQFLGKVSNNQNGN